MSVLGQVLPKRPELYVDNCSYDEESAELIGRSYPIRVQYLGDFFQNQKLKLDTYDMHKPLDITSTPLIKSSGGSLCNVNTVADFFISKNIAAQIHSCSTVGKITSSSLMERECTSNSSNPRYSLSFPIAECHFFMHDESGIFGVVQSVSRVNVRFMPDSGVEVAQKYGNPCSNKIDKQWCRAVAFLWGNMIDQRTKYGMLTSYERTWFFIACDEDCLRVSDAVHCDQPGDSANLTLLQCVASFMNLAKSDFDDYSLCFPVGGRHSLLSGASTDVTAERRSSRKRKRMCKMDNIPVTTETQHTVQIGLLGIHRTLGTGRMGAVYEGIWRGEPVAEKLIDSTQIEQCEALRKELIIYEHLCARKCDLVPTVFEFFNVTSGGNLIGFAMELLQELPCDFQEFTEQQIEEVVQVVQLLTDLALNYGVIQNDIRPHNFGLSSRGKILAIDFEDVGWNAPEDAVQRYVNSIKRQIDIITPGTLGTRQIACRTKACCVVTQIFCDDMKKDDQQNAENLTYFPFKQVTMGGASSLIQHKNLLIDDDIHIRSFQTSLKFESAGDEASDALRVKLLTTVLPLFMAQLDDDNIVNSIRENVIAMNAVKVIDDVELKHVIPRNNKWLATLISSVEHLDLIVSVATARADRPGFPLIYVNKSFERVMQYDRSAIIGTNCKFLQSDKTDPQHIEILSDALRSAKAVKVTLVNKRKDGTEFNNLLSLCPVFDKEGVYSYVIGVQTDLSVRQPTEAEMQLVDDLTRELSNLSALLY